jgi:hypothetical protein
MENYGLSVEPYQAPSVELPLKSYSHIIHIRQYFGSWTVTWFTVHGRFSLVQLVVPTY